MSRIKSTDAETLGSVDKGASDNGWASVLASELERVDERRVGRFVLLHRLGEGGMGVVFSAYDELLDRRVAIKIVRADRGGASWQARIVREAQALARLSHPNVVQIYEAGVYAARVYLVMEYVAGGTLRDWLAAQDVTQASAVSRTLARFTEAARGLAAAHAAGLVHRDFKPESARRAMWLSAHGSRARARAVPARVQCSSGVTGAGPARDQASKIARRWRSVLSSEGGEASEGEEEEEREEERALG